MYIVDETLYLENPEEAIAFFGYWSDKFSKAEKELKKYIEKRKQAQNDTLEKEQG